jgi:hypothetical protein
MPPIIGQFMPGVGAESIFGMPFVRVPQLAKQALL